MVDRCCFGKQAAFAFQLYCLSLFYLGVSIDSIGPGQEKDTISPTFLRGCPPKVKNGGKTMGEALNELKKVIPLLNDNPRAKEILEGWPRTVNFELDSEGGPFHVIVADGKIRTGEGAAAKEADIVVKGDSREFSRVVRRERDITHPMAEGHLWVTKGKLSQLVIFDRVLATAKRRR